MTLQTGRPFELLGGYNTFNYSNATWPRASDSGVVLNGINRRQLQSAVGTYNGPTASEPVTFLPQSYLSNSGGGNPSLISPETTAGQLGGQIFLHEPFFWNVDLSVLKAIPIAEHIKLNIWAEFLDAFNHTDWGVLDTYSGRTNGPANYAPITSNTFAQATAVNWPRNIQFRLQLAF